jgi:hypothetical protein
MKGRLLIAAGIVVIIIGGVFAPHSGCGTADPPRSDWRVVSGLLDKLGWYAATSRRLGVVMTVRRHDRPHPHIERTFTAVRAALPAANVAAFDTELEAITHAPVVDLAALDEFLSGWWRIATRAVTDPADWQRMHQEAEQLQSGARSAGPTLAEVLGRRGVQL